MTMRLRRFARFGKAGTMDDYAWLDGEARVSALLRAVAPKMVEHSGRSRGVVSVAGVDSGLLYLAHTYLIAPDASGRPIIGVDVSEIVGGSDLGRASWIGCVTAALNWMGPAPERLDLHPATPAPRAAVNGELIARAVLGVPCDVNDAEAASLLDRFPGRFSAVLCGIDPRDLNNQPGSTTTVNVLLLRTSSSSLTTEQAALLADWSNSAFQDADIELLASLPIEGARRAVRWLREPNAVALSDSPEDAPILRWAVAYRGRSHRGAALLDVLRRQLTESAFRVAATTALSTIGAEANSIVRAWATGRVPQLTVGGLEALAEAGLLESDTILPLHTWLGYAAQSPQLQQAATQRLVAHGLTPESAAFVLDLPPSGHASIEPRDLGPAIAMAVGLRLAAPLTRIRHALDRVSQHAEAEDWDRAVRGYGGLAAALAGACAGDLSGLDRIQGEDLIRVAKIRRTIGVPRTTAELVVALMRATRMADARTVAESFAESAVSEATEWRAVRAALGLAPPAVIGDVASITHLIDQHLLRPNDIVAANVAALTSIAETWSDLAPLAAPFLALDGVPDLDRLSSEWRGFFQAHLTPSVVGRWLSRCSTRRETALGFVAQVLPDAAAAARLLDSSAAAGDLVVADSAWPWCVELAGGTAQSARLRVLAHVARRQQCRGDEHRASEIVRRLLPELDDPSRELCVLALSGIGAFPSIEGIVIDVIGALIDSLPPTQLIDALMRAPVSAIDGDDALLSQIAVRIKTSNAACPASGYSMAQRRRHHVLAQRLSALPTWEALALDRQARLELAQEWLTRLEVSAAEVRDALPAAKRSVP